MKNPFYNFRAFDYALYAFSVVAVTAGFLIPAQKDWLSYIGSLVGVSALIFIAKGRAAGQFLTIIFAILYSVSSFFFGYYGEIATYAGMTLPMAAVAAVQWIRHPAKGGEVKVAKLSVKKIVILALSGAAVTAGFYFILRALDTPNLVVSTVSVATSYYAAALTVLRSPYYALFYALNDVVLTVLWSLASAVSISYLPYAVCFVAFFFSDAYGFISWKKMEKRQKKDEE